MSAAERPPRNDHEQPAEEVESDDEDDEEDEEYMVIDLSDFKELKCAICLGIIRNTRTVTECLHRFCKECIEKSMRLGINECPICRVHVPSRRSLREDPNFDNLISALVPDIDKYEEQEELAFLEDGSSHDKEIEASGVQNLPCETEALDRKQKARAMAVAFDRMRRSQGKNRTSHMKRRRNLRNAGEVHVSNETGAMNNNSGKDLCSGEEKTETRPRKGGKREAQFPQECATNVDREICPSANVHQSKTVLSSEEKTEQETSQNVNITENLANDYADRELEKDHVEGVHSLVLEGVDNVTFQSTTRLSGGFSNLDSDASSQLKEEVIELRHKLRIVEENFKTLKDVMFKYIQMKEGYIPKEFSTIFDNIM